MKNLSYFIRQYWLVSLLCALVTYFFLAALQGNAGVFRLIQLNAQIDTATENYNNLLLRRHELENLTHRLSNEYLDLDLLDEQARKRLGLVREDEIIVE